MNDPLYDEGGFIPSGVSWVRNTSGVPIAVNPAVVSERDKSEGGTA